MLYEVAIIAQVTDDAFVEITDARGQRSKAKLKGEQRKILLVAPQAVLAPDADRAKLTVMRQLTKEQADMNIEVLCRPFA